MSLKHHKATKTFVCAGNAEVPHGRAPDCSRMIIKGERYVRWTPNRGKPQESTPHCAACAEFFFRYVIPAVIALFLAVAPAFAHSTKEPKNPEPPSGPGGGGIEAPCVWPERCPNQPPKVKGD